MTEKTEITCISCPVGCRMTVWQDGEDRVHVEGNSCKRGETYGAQELTDPRRIVTTSVAVDGGERPLVSVKTASPIPKAKITEALTAIHERRLSAPVVMGQVVLADVAGTGIDVLTTSHVEL